MINRLGSYLAARPDRAAAIVLALIAALILVLAGMIVQNIGIGKAPYPSDDLPISLVDGRVVYNQTETTVVAWGDSYVPFNYTGMRIAFQIDWGGMSSRTTGPFGNQTLLSTGYGATMEDWLVQGSQVNVSISISESTGDGSFDAGDSITFNIDPFSEDVTYTFGLYWVHAFGMKMYTEMSFAIHNGHLYKWLSRDLPTEQPWWE